jgi:hypothetical protein
MAAESSFLLSELTEAVWLDKGGIQLRRVKDEDDDFDAGYKIYVPYPALKTIVNKKKIIQDSAQQVSDSEVESPLNITLYKRQVMRLSLFYEELYYGIHQLEEGTGKIKIGKGMNFSQLEFDVLLTKLEQRFKSQSSAGTSGNGGSPGGDGEDDEGDVPPAKSRKRSVVKVTGQKKKMMDNLSFNATMYGWYWYSEVGGQYIQNDENAERWHFSAKDCFFDATNNKPIGEDYKLDVFDKLQSIAVNTSLWDAAFAKLVRYNSSMCAQEDKISGMYTTEQDDLDTYGRLAFERISLNEIYELSRKAIAHYTPLNKDMELFLMKMGVTYIKPDDFISRMRVDEFDPLLVELMDYIHLLD